MRQTFISWILFSRRGRGKSGGSARNREEPGASEMSREAAQSAEANQPNQAEPALAAAENQQGGVLPSCFKSATRS